MKNILFVNACVRECSRTKELADYLLSELSGNVNEIKLSDENIEPLGAERLAKRDRLLKEGRTDGELFYYAQQFASADEIVIAAPYWDLMFPSILKVYLENITVGGITFRYTKTGMIQSLCNAKKLYYVTTSGGYIGENNFGYEYISRLAEDFFGISEICFYSAEGLDIEGADVVKILEAAKERMIN